LTEGFNHPPTPPQSPTHKSSPDRLSITKSRPFYAIYIAIPIHSLCILIVRLACLSIVFQINNLTEFVSLPVDEWSKAIENMNKMKRMLLEEYEIECLNRNVGLLQFISYSSHCALN